MNRSSRAHRISWIAAAAALVSTSQLLTTAPVEAGDDRPPAALDLFSAVTVEQFEYLSRMADRPDALRAEMWPPGPGPFLQDLGEGDAGAEATASLEKLVVEAVVRADPDAPPAGVPAVEEVPEIDAVVWAQIFAPRAVSSRRRLGKLQVRLWVAGSRQRAIELYWLRSGNGFEVRSDEVTARAWTTTSPLTGLDVPGEAAYVYRTELIYNAPRVEGTPGGGDERVGMLLGNVIVEAGRHTSFRHDDDGPWLALGLSGDDRKTLFSILGSIAEGLQGGQQ